MFAFKKLLTPFLQPPGLFIAVLIISGIYFSFRKPKRAGILMLFIGLCLWFFSIGPVSDTLLGGLERGFSIPENPRGDVIILLGGGVHEGVQDLSGIGSPSEDMLARVVTAVRLQKKMGVPVIVSGGTAFSWRGAEAPVVRRFLMDLGVPGEKIILEERSRDTLENANYTRLICESRGFRQPVLVTSAYHMKRSILSFRHFDLDVTPFPAHFKTWKKKYGWADYLPGDFRGSFIACREYIGLLYHRIVL
jgi:uncharacterized SAM-binding protein YcdF (DUF218 family)